MTDGTWRVGLGGCVVGGCLPAIPPQPLAVRAENPCRAVEDETRNLLRLPSTQARCADWLVLAHLLDSSHRTHFPGLLRRARLRELISRAYLAELVDPNSADEDVLNSSFNSYEPDVLNSSSEDAFKTSSAHLTKTYSTRLPLVFPRRVRRMT